MTKWIKRHQISMAASLVIALTLVVGLVISTAMYSKAQRVLNALAKLEDKVETDQFLTRTQRLSAEGRYEAALSEIESMLKKRNLGPKAQLLNAQILFQVGRQTDAQSTLMTLTSEGPEIAGAAHSLLARISLGTDPSKAEEHKQQAEKMLPNTAEAYCLRAMTSPSPEKALQWLDRAIGLDPSHCPSRKARALTYYRLAEDQKMVEDVASLIALRPADSLGYALRAVLRRESDRFEEAIADHTRAIELCGSQTELSDLYHQRYETYTRMGDHAAALKDARLLAELDPEEFWYRFFIFTSSFALKDFAAARHQYRSIVQTSPDAHRIDRQVARYVFDTLSKGQFFAVPPDMAEQAPFAHMQRVAQCHHTFANKARLLELKRQGFLLWGWSPDGTEILVGWMELYRGMAGMIDRTGSPAPPITAGLKIIHIESGRERQVVSDYRRSAAWSPDGKYIAYLDPDYVVCIVPAEGGQTRKFVPGIYVQWSQDSRNLYFLTSHRGGDVCVIDIDEPDSNSRKADGVPGSLCHQRRRKLDRL